MDPLRPTNDPQRSGWRKDLKDLSHQLREQMVGRHRDGLAIRGDLMIGIGVVGTLVYGSGRPPVLGCDVHWHHERHRRQGAEGEQPVQCWGPAH